MYKVQNTLKNLSKTAFLKCQEKQYERSLVKTIVLSRLSSIIHSGSCWGSLCMPYFLTFEISFLLCICDGLAGDQNHQPAQFDSNFKNWLFHHKAVLAKHVVSSQGNSPKCLLAHVTSCCELVVAA